MATQGQSGQDPRRPQSHRVGGATDLPGASLDTWGHRGSSKLSDYTHSARQRQEPSPALPSVTFLPPFQPLQAGCLVPGEVGGGSGGLD